MWTTVLAAQEFRYLDPSVSGFKSSGTLFRLDSIQGSNAVVEVYQRDPKTENRIPLKKKTIPLPVWNVAPLASLKTNSASNVLLVKQRTGPAYFQVLNNSGKPLYCAQPSKIAALEKETNRVVAAASIPAPQPPAPPRPVAPEGSTHQTENVAGPSPVRERVIVELKQDFQWVRDLNLDSRFDLKSAYNKAEAVRSEYLALRKKSKTKNLQEKEKEALENHQKILNDLEAKQSAGKNLLLESIFLDPRFNGTKGSVRADRLLRSLTLLGEFRLPSHQTTAHFYWAEKVMENRARKEFFSGAIQFDPSKSFPEERKSELDSWFTNTPAAAALSRAQFSVWTTTDIGNLYSILAQPRSDQQSRDRVAKFISDYEAGDFDANDPGIMTYYSPSIPEPSWFKPLAFPSVTNKITGAIETSNPAHFIGGTYRKKGK